MSFRQCPKKLWLEKYRPDLAEEDPGREAIFQMGHEVGAIARRLYDSGGGVLIEYDDDLSTAIKQTLQEIAGNSTAPIFEATLERNGLLARADIFVRDGGGARLVEVKASTKIKEEHVADCAIQSWVFEASPTCPKRISVAHVNNQFVYQGNGDYTGLLAEADISADVAFVKASVPEWLDAAKTVLAGKEPTAEIGTRCWKPYDCPFQGHCWEETPYPTRRLPGIGARLNALLAAGHKDVRALPEGLLKGADQLRAWRAVQSGEASLSAAARAEFTGLGFPRYYLDFETISFAVPRWSGTRPYQQLPFQWSLHIEDQNGQLRHESFLDLSGKLPVRAVATALLDAAGREGSVFIYTAFERQCLRTLATFCPELNEQLEALSGRLLDLHPIAKRHYYHPAMQGSWSIKSILPTIAPELDYAHLGEIQEGNAAQQAFLEAIAPTTTVERHTAVRQALLEYCNHDTLAMVTVARYLEGR